MNVNNILPLVIQIVKDSLPFHFSTEELRQAQEAILAEIEKKLNEIKTEEG